MDPGAVCFQLFVSSLLQSGTVLQSFVSFHELDIFGDHRSIVLHTTSQFAIVLSFFTIIPILCIFGQNITEIMLCSSHCILSGGIQYRWIITPIKGRKEKREREGKVTYVGLLFSACSAQ